MKKTERNATEKLHQQLQEKEKEYQQVLQELAALRPYSSGKKAAEFLQQTLEKERRKCDAAVDQLTAHSLISHEETCRSNIIRLHAAELTQLCLQHVLSIPPSFSLQNKIAELRNTLSSTNVVFRKLEEQYREALKQVLTLREGTLSLRDAELKVKELQEKLDCMEQQLHDASAKSEELQRAETHNALTMRRLVSTNESLTNSVRQLTDAGTSGAS